MATKFDDNGGQFKDLLTCTICLEVFKVPKYLPCLHTFCESCLSTYISSCLEKDSKITEFKCPVCKRGVVMKETLGLPKQWAKNLPSNHLVVSMMDKQAITKSEKLCNSCEVNLETVKAVSWCTVCEEGLCKACEKCHKSFKMTTGHLIILLEKMNDDKTIVSIGGMVGCENHVGKVLEFFCVDHAKPCCTVCATLSHRKCETVILIDSAATGIKQSEKAKNLLKRLQDRGEHIQNLITNRKETIRLVESQSGKILTQIDDVKDTVIKHLNELADKAKEHVTSSKKNSVISLTDEVTELSSLKSTVDNWKNILQTCLQHGSEQQCLIEIEKITSKYSEQNGDDNEIISQLTKFSMTFELNKMLTEFPTNVQSFGVLSQETSNLNVNARLSLVNFRTGKISIVHTIDIGQVQGNYKSGIFVDDSIVLTDHAATRIVKYNASCVYQSELILPKALSDITAIEKNTVAVASAYSSDIYVINITYMTLTKTITTSVKMFGLTYVEGGFITANNETLTWMSKDGTKQNERKTNGNSFLICSVENDSYICADGNKAVSLFTKDAKRTFTYTSQSLELPRGIDVDSEGNVWIVGCTSGNIHQLTNKGELIRIIPTAELGIKQPWILRFKRRSATFLLTSYDAAKVLICEVE